MNSMPNTQYRISPAERKWIVWVALIGMFITTIPYFIGYSMQGEDWRFTGFVFGVNDGNSYIAKMRLGAAGDWLFRTPYTAFEQKGFLAYLPFILLGKLTTPPAQHEQTVSLFHLFRFLGGVLAILATYDFIAYFVNQIPLRRWGTLLASFGGGLGWLLVLLGQGDWLGSLPLDFYSPETFGFLSLYGLPHLAVTRALLLWGLLAYLQNHPPQSGFQMSLGIQAGLLWLFMGFFQPLAIAAAWAATGAHLMGYGLSLMLQRYRNPPVDFQLWLKYFQRAIVAGLVSVPFVLYSFLVLGSDPFLRGWTEQNTILSPHPLHYFAAYGLVLPFAVKGAVQYIRVGRVRNWLLIGWAMLLPLLAYLPFNLQRRLPEGIWVVYVTLAMGALDRFDKPSRTLFVPLLLVFPTTLLLILGGITGAMGLHPPIFRPASEVEAFLFLDEAAQPGDLVLTSFESGNALPAWATVRVIIGHGPESVGLVELQPLVDSFFGLEMSNGEREAFLDEMGVEFVFWGPYERMSGGWNPAQLSRLREIYSQGEYSIFEVVP